MLYKKRTYEDRPVTSVTTDGLPAMKMQRLDGRTNIVQPKGRVATLTRIQGKGLFTFFKFVYIFRICFLVMFRFHEIFYLIFNFFQAVKDK